MIGTGYVGLVTGACFAELGHDVVCVDQNEKKIELLRRGQMPIYEPALEQLVQRNVELGRLRFAVDTKSSVGDREAVFIAVGTPSAPETGRADLQYIFQVAADVADAIDRFTVVVTKSTVPVGTNQKVYDAIRAKVGDVVPFAVASNPEFLREGAAIQDFMEPDRIVIGFEDSRAAEVMRRIYAPLTGKGVRMVETNIATAEMVKYAANAFLAVKVSFINEVADLCEAVGADVEDVATGIGLDKRIGLSFLRTGPGWGGSCFPKDTRAMAMTARDVSIPVRIVEAAIEANDRRKETMIYRIRRMCDGKVSGKKIAVLGLTFKGQTDDMRESPSLDILTELCRQGASISAYDPSDPSEAKVLLPGVELCGSAVEAAQDADLLVVLTDWMIFKAYNLAEFSSIMRVPALLDLRNMYDGSAARHAGFARYENLGKASDWIAVS
jgi:UDPglucose 6-dehydrogenase